MDTPTIDELRARYFIEVWQPEAYADSSWRGCALDRDEYNNTRMPRLLFEAIITAANTRTLIVAADFGSSLHAEVPANWEAYSAHMLARENYSIDYVICDDTGDWACLFDFDVTTFGATRLIADRVDRILAESGTSLRALTIEAFGDHEHDPHIRSILGSVA